MSVPRRSQAADPTVLEAALRYAALGLPVLPIWWPRGTGCACGDVNCKRPGKHPLGKAVRRGCKDATTDAARIRWRWWNRWPQANLGIATGMRTFFVLDIDPEGVETLARLETTHGPLPATIEQSTGRGRHLLFAWPLDGRVIPNSARTKLGPGLDVRGEGGYIVVDPSAHVSGARYAWRPGHGPGEIALGPAPPWLVDLACGNPAPAIEARPEPALLALGTNGAATRRIKRWAEAALEREVEAVRMAPEGQRNDALNTAAYSLGQLIPAGHLNQARVVDALTGAAGTAGLRGPEVGKTIRSGLEAGMKKPRESPPDSASRVVPLRPRSAPGAGAAPDDPTPDLVGLAQSDTGNAHRLLARFGHDLLWGPHTGWLVWDGRRWCKDDRRQAVEFSQCTASLIFNECALLPDQEHQAKRAKWAVASQNRGRIDGMLAMAEPHRAIMPEQLDTDPWLLNCLNGIVDLRTGELRPHDRKLMITKLAPVSYDPAAQAPAWERFLLEVFEGDEELAAFVQRAAGYSLTGSTDERVLIILWGSKGFNGKSTLLRTLGELLGDYAMDSPTSTFERKEFGDGIPNDRARLAGARFVSAVESKEGARLDEPLVKQMTGGDPLPARFLHREWFQYTPEFKLWLATNHKPRLSGSDNALWERIILLPFLVHFRHPDEAAPGEPVRDVGLKGKLAAELPGILAWAVRGCLDWQRAGLRAPAKVRTAKAAYRSESDTVGSFITDRCLVGPSYSVRATALYEAYGQWCQENGVDPVSQAAFGRDLTDRDYATVTGAGGYKVRRGLGLKEDR